MIYKTLVSFLVFLCYDLNWTLNCISIYGIRDIRSPHGWKPSTCRNSSPLAQFMMLPRKTRRIFAVWIVAQAFVLIVYFLIDPTGFFRFVDMCTTRLSDWRTLRSLWTAQTSRFWLIFTIFFSSLAWQKQKKKKFLNDFNYV